MKNFNLIFKFYFFSSILCIISNTYLLTKTWLFWSVCYTVTGIAVCLLFLQFTLSNKWFKKGAAIFLYFLVYWSSLLAINSGVITNNLLLLTLLVILYTCFIWVFYLRDLIDFKVTQVTILVVYLFLFFVLPVIYFNILNTFGIFIILSVLLVQWLFLYILETKVSKSSFMIIATSIIVLGLVHTPLLLHQFIFLLFVMGLYLIFLCYKNKASGYVASFIKDAKTIEYHFDKEFFFYNILRKIIILDILILIRFYSMLSKVQWPKDFFSQDPSLALLILSVILILFTCIVRFTIVEACNPPISLKFMQHCLTCATAVGSVGTFGTVVVVSSTTPGVTPPPIPDKPLLYMQRSLYEFGWRTQQQGLLGQFHTNVLGSPPPLDSKGFVDEVKTKANINLWRETHTSDVEKRAYNLAVRLGNNAVRYDWFKEWK